MLIDILRSCFDIWKCFFLNILKVVSLKYVLTIVILCPLIFLKSSLAQSKITFIAPYELKENIEKSGKPSIIQFWVPNCANAQETITGYKKMEEQYGQHIDFYFIGLTNKEILVADLVNEVRYPYQIYIADTTTEVDINLRKNVFCKLFNEYFSQQKQKDFITVFLDRNDHIVYSGNRLKLKRKQVKKLIRQ